MCVYWRVLQLRTDAVLKEKKRIPWPGKQNTKQEQKEEAFSQIASLLKRQRVYRENSSQQNPGFTILFLITLCAYCFLFHGRFLSEEYRQLFCDHMYNRKNIPFSILQFFNFHAKSSRAGFFGSPASFYLLKSIFP